MASISWKGGSGDWMNAAGWSGGAVPGASDAVTMAGAGSYTVTLYAAAQVAGLTLNAPGALFYDAGALTVGGTFTLQAGTFALAYGSLNGGTLAMAGGTLQASGGTLNGVAVQGALALSQTNATLFVQNGLNMAGAGGTGAGALAVTGTYAALDFLGTQTLANAVVTLGAVAGGAGQGGPATLQAHHAYGASTGATLTLAASIWLRQSGQLGQLIVGGAVPGPVTDTILNQGTITAANQGGTLLLGGAGNFVNQGTIGISNGATLEIASGGFTNIGTIVVSNATLDLGGTFASGLLNNLGALSLIQATVEIDGKAQNNGATLTLGSATSLGPLLLAGTISGGTVLDSGGGLNLSARSGMLDNVTYKGTLALGAGAAVTLTGNSVLSTAVGAAGTASITGAAAALLLQGQMLLDNATIALGSNTGSAASIATADPWLAGAATTATLGPHLVLQQTGKYAAITASATTPIAGFGLADTLVNQGTITGNFAGGTLSIGGGGQFINQGVISASNGDSLLIGPATFSNTGTILLTTGAAAQLGGPTDIFGQSPSWSNSGTINVNNASLTLSGAIRTPQIGRIGGNGTVTLAGTLANAGSTLTLGTGGNLPNATLTGTIQGGTLADVAGLLAFGTSYTALLDGVTDTGPLNLTGAGSYLRIRNGLTLLGPANISGAGATVAFQGSQTFDKAQLNLGATGRAAVLDVLHDGSSTAPTTLTLGPTMAITQTGALAAIGAATDVAGDVVVNYGTITAATPGGIFNFAGAGFANRGRIAVSNGDTLLLTAASVANSGTIAVSNAALSIADSISLANLGSLALSNASLTVGGTLALGAGTLAIGAGSAWGRVQLTGQIASGTILDSGQGLGVTGNATLNGVTYRGLLDLSRPFQQLTLTNAITITDTSGTQPGTATVTGAASRLLIAGSETINNATVVLGSAGTLYFGQHVAPAELAVGPAATLTLGPTAHIRASGIIGWLGDSSVGQWTDSIINNGIIMQATPLNILTIGSSFFTNNGQIVVGGNGNLICADVGFTNSLTGTVSVFGGSILLVNLYNFYAAPNGGATPFTNSGTLRMLGGVMQEMIGGGLFPAVGLVNNPGGLIQGLGNIAAPIVNSGLIEAKFGPYLAIAGTITGTGTMQIDAGCQLQLNGPVAASQTVSFTASGETLRLDQYQSFAARTAGFTSGDAIDITGTQINNVAISNGTLVLGTGTGQFRLASTTTLGGAVSIGNDHHGGATALYTDQQGGGGVGGGTIVTLGVSQPGMLFWTSPVGDILAGTAANIAGTQIFNWTTADSIDLLDFLGTNTTVAYAQATGQGTITVTDGTHADHITLVGSFNANWFHVSTDGHTGALITYHA